MNQDNAQPEKRIKIDPAAFADLMTDRETGDSIFGEVEVLKYLIDQLNAAGVDITMIHHDHELAIEYGGRRDYYSMPIASLDAPEVAVMDGMTELSAILTDHEGIESWVSYKDGKQSLHIAESEEPDGDSEASA